MTESKLRLHILTLCSKHDPTHRMIRVQPIESPATASGIPDLAVRTRHFDSWMELKVSRSTQEPYKVDWRPGQRPWALSHDGLSGRVFLMLLTPQVASDGHELWLFKGYGNLLLSYTHEDLWSKARYHCGNWKSLDFWDLEIALNKP